MDQQAYLDWLLGSDGSTTFDTNAATNPAAAAATAPVITNANGTSSVTSSGWSGFLTALIPAADGVQYRHELQHGQGRQSGRRHNASGQIKHHTLCHRWCYRRRHLRFFLAPPPL